MAITLNLVKASTTLALNGGSTYTLLEEYQPRVQLTSEQMDAVLAGTLNPKNQPTVTDSIKLRVTAASIAALQTAIHDIEKIFVDAYRRNRTMTGDRVFMKFTPSGGASAYRSEILTGRVETLPKTLAVWQWDAKDIEIIVAWTRRFFLEKDSETTAPLTNGNGSNLTTGLNLFNCNDGSGSSPNKRNNYAEIAAADVTGVLPTPARIEITHTFAANAARRFYIAHKAQGTPASFTHILEAEDASLNATYAASAVDANASGGNTVNVTNVPAAVATLATWTINSTQAGYILSNWVQVLARFSTLPTNSTIKVRLTLKDSTSGAIIAQTDYTTLSAADYLQQLASLEMSPAIEGQTTPGAMKLLLEAKDAAATGDFGLDFIQLSPAEGGNGFRLLKPVDETLVSVAASTGVLTDNMIDGSGPTIESQQQVYQGYGGPIMLQPGVLQRLYILHDSTNASAVITRSISLIVKFRERVLTV